MQNFLSKKLNRSNLKLFLLIVAVIAAYVYFLCAMKAEHDHPFNVRDTITWVQTSDGIHRIAAKGNIENFLISQDRWRDFRLTLSIVNPSECGLLYDYVDSSNYGFIYFQNASGRIVSGRFKGSILPNGRTESIKTIPFNLSNSPTILLQKEGGMIRLAINDQPVLQLKSEVPVAKIGLMLNAVVNPPTIFAQIRIQGHLDNGQAIKSHEATAGSVSNGMWGGLKSFLPFYLIFALLIVLAPGLIISFCRGGFPWPVFQTFQDGQTRPYGQQLRNLYAIAIHIFLAVCFFWPFFWKGQIAIFSYDNLGEIYPLFFYAKHNFQNILHGQAPWLWNSLIHNGFPFYSNHWDMIYYPLNWPVFLFSDKNLLTALTGKSFLEVVGIGIFAYGFFALEFKNKRWALFSSVAYQLCSLLIFTMSVFPATSLYFAMTLYLYVLWSMPYRRALLNFLFLTFAVVLILTSANVAFIFYACLTLAVISIYRFLSLGKDGGRIFTITAFAWITGTLISSVRIISCLEGVMASNRVAENFQTIHDRAYMALRLFVPEITGWMGPNSLPVLMSSNLKLIFAGLDMPSNPQNSFFVYFGVLPALLLVVSFLITTKGKHTFWKIYSVVALGIALLWQPFWGILSILCFPLNHYSYHIIILPVGICSLIGYTGMAFEAEKINWESLRPRLLLALGLIGAYLFVFITYLFPSLAPLTRMVFITAGASIVIYYGLRHRYPDSGEHFLLQVRAGVNILLLAMLTIVTLLLILQPIYKKEAVITGLTLPFLWIAAATVMVLNIYFQNTTNRMKWASLIPLALTLFLSGMVVISPWGKFFLSLPESLRVYGVDVVLGGIRLLLLLQIGIFALSGSYKKIFSKHFAFCLILIFTIGDLIVFNARFNNITAPFYFKEAFYPKDFSYKDLNPDFKKQADLVNYRVSHQHQQDFNANKNLVFALPSYTGTVGYMTRRFSKFLTTFGYPAGIYMLYPEDASNNSRFLDLSAVRYVLGDKNRVLERPTALGRLNFIYSAEVIRDDDKLLNRLKEENFDPHQVVLLSDASAIPLSRAEENSFVVSISKAAPDKIEASFQTDAPGFLLFNESYDEGWKALLDGSPVKILRANYNFMACPIITPGRHEVRWSYDPPAYKRNLFLSIAGLLIVGFACLVSIFRAKRKRGQKGDLKNAS